MEENSIIQKVLKDGKLTMVQEIAIDRANAGRLFFTGVAIIVVSHLVGYFFKKYL